MKKHILLVLGLALFMAGQVLASGTVGLVNTTTGAGGTLISLQSVGNTTPTTYTAKSCIGQGVLVTKVIAYNATYATAATWSLWDCPQGLTYAAGARLVTGGYIPASVAAGTVTMSYDTHTSARTDEDGLYFRYYPVWVDNGANSIVASILYRPWTSPTKSGAAQ